MDCRFFIKVAVSGVWGHTHTHDSIRATSGSCNVFCGFVVFFCLFLKVS